MPQTLIHLCVTCQPEGAPESEPPAGKLLFDAVAARLEKSAMPAVALRPVECLMACGQGCNFAISAPRKWTYLIGGLAPDQDADVLLFAQAYEASRSGAVLPSRRPASIVVHGRIPPSDADTKESRP